jgi:hypothetical protein
MLGCYWINACCVSSSGSVRGTAVLSLLLLHGTGPVLSCKQVRNCLYSEIHLHVRLVHRKERFITMNLTCGACLVQCALQQNA